MFFGFSWGGGGRFHDVPSASLVDILIIFFRFRDVRSVPLEEGSRKNINPKTPSKGGLFFLKIRLLKQKKPPLDCVFGFRIFKKKRTPLVPVFGFIFFKGKKASPTRCFWFLGGGGGVSRRTKRASRGGFDNFFLVSRRTKCASSRRLPQKS